MFSRPSDASSSSCSNLMKEAAPDEEPSMVCVHACHVHVHVCLGLFLVCKVSASNTKDNSCMYLHVL